MRRNEIAARTAVLTEVLKILTLCPDSCVLLSSFFRLRMRKPFSLARFAGEIELLTSGKRRKEERGGRKERNEDVSRSVLECNKS